MRIIDKNTDFYDYLQNIYRDNSLTFDRTNSFILSKETVCNSLESHSMHYWWDKEKHRDFNFVLLQVCNTFWLFLVEITELSEFGRPTNFVAELLHTWRNYDRERKLIKLNVISFPDLRPYGWHTKWVYDKVKITNKIDDIVEAVNQSNYKIEFYSFGLHEMSLFVNNKKITKNIPLLKASGLAQLINPLDIYLAFEEYFSFEKTASERIYSKGITDKEKIENHGFDVVTSFRGKN